MWSKFTNDLPTNEKVWNKMSEEKSVFIATPTYGGMVMASYAVSIILLGNDLNEAGWPWIYHITEGSFIPHSRNACVKAFLESPCSHIMFIDADMTFDSRDMVKMLDHDKDVIGGLYPKKRFPLEYNANLINKEDSNATGLQEVYDVATGLMVVKRDVFEKLESVVPTYKSHDQEYKDYFSITTGSTGALIGEDYNFCRLWRENGGKVYADFSVKAAHIGLFAFGANNEEL